MAAMAGWATPNQAHAHDPFGPAPGASSTGGAVGGAIAGCGHLTSARCSEQNTTMLGMAAGYVVLCVAVVALWRASWAKKGHGSQAAQFFVPMFVGAISAGALVGLDPARGEDLRCCLADAVFRPAILFQESNAARAVVLGVLPAALLYTVIVFVQGALRRS